MAMELEGADTLARTLSQAAHRIDDLTDLHQQLGDLVVAAAGPLTPRRTGALAAATTAIAASDVTTISNPLRYAAPVHARFNPWLATAAEQTAGRQLDTAERHVQAILDTVKGL